MPGVCLFVCLSTFATLRKIFWTDVRENFSTDVPADKEKPVQILEVIRLLIRIQEFFEGFFNTAK